MSIPGFPTIISNEPPPCESDEDEDHDIDDDEFHSIGLKLDCLTEQSPFSTPRKLPIPIDQSSETENENQSPNTHINHNHESPSPENDNETITIYENGESTHSHLEIDNEDDDEVHNVINSGENEESIPSPSSCPHIAESPDEIVENEPIIENEEIPEVVDIDTGQADPVIEGNECNEDDDDDEFGDFGFSGVVKPKNDDSIQESPTVSIEKLPDNPSGIPNTLDHQEEPPGPNFEANFDDDDDEFGDFGEFESSPSETKESLSESKSEPSPQSVTSNGSSESLVKLIFAQNSCENSETSPISGSVPFVPLDKELITSPNSVWNHVNEFEDSRCLQFKWAESRIHQQLLTSLNIDTSTVLYRGKWGAIEVPKFAANLVDVQGCLQPEVSFQPIQNETEENGGSKSPNSPSKCTAEGDEDSPINEVSGDNGKKKNSATPLSKEASRVLEQLPDLSYMRAKTLIFPRTPKY